MLFSILFTNKENSLIFILWLFTTTNFSQIFIKTLLIKLYKKIGYQVVPFIKLNYKVNLKIEKSMCSFYKIVL